MKKKGLFIAVVMAVLLIGGYFVFDCAFPVAAPMKSPSIESVASITVSGENGQRSAIQGTDAAKAMTYIANAEPTRKTSVHDAPSVFPYYTIEVAADGKTFRYYVYEEDHSVYVEVPYEGIYLADEQLLSLCS